MGSIFYEFSKIGPKNLSKRQIGTWGKNVTDDFSVSRKDSSDV